MTGAFAAPARPSYDVDAALLGDVLSFIAAGDEDCAAFDGLALRLFRWHLEAIPAYRRFCLGRVGGWEAVRRFRDIPLLPTKAFRLAELCARTDAIVRRFATSGTTKGGSPGIAPLDAPSLEVMEQAIERNAERFLFCDGVRPRIVVLAPPPDDVPHVVMAYGMQLITRRFGTERSLFVGTRYGLDVDALVDAIDASRESGEPIGLLGASFSFVHALDALAGRGALPKVLPPGSRAMDAGGYKGRSRSLEPGEFREAMRRAFGLEEKNVVNLLGMTELASQMYDDCFAAACAGQGGSRRKKVAPPWARTRVVDFDDPRVDVSDGEIGLLAHWDLANFGRPIGVLSDDIGRRLGDGFEILGRVGSVEPRGCSITVDELWRGT